MSSGVSLLGRLDQDLARDLRGMEEPATQELRATLTELRQALGPLVKKEQEIRSSPRWDAWEKQDRLQELKAQTSGLVTALLGKKAALDEKVNRLREKLSEIEPTTDNQVVRELRNAEVRAILRNMDESARAQILLDAAAAGTIAVLDAMRMSTLPLVSGALQQRVLDLYGEKHKPETFAALEQTTLLKEHTDSLVQHVDQWRAGLNQS